MILDLTNGDDLRLRAVENGGQTPQTAVDGTSLTIKKFVETGADFAEVYYTEDDNLDAGDIVIFDPALRTGVEKTTLPYEKTILGVISTDPGHTIGAGDHWDGGRPVPVALAGRVPVKVSNENGPIAQGDFLTASSTPGVAMKATENGTIVGIAMDDFEFTEPGQIGYVMTFIDVRDVNITGPALTLAEVLDSLESEALVVESFGDTVGEGSVDDEEGERDLTKELAIRFLQLEQKVLALEESGVVLGATDTTEEALRAVVQEELGALASWNFEMWNFSTDVAFTSKAYFEGAVAFLDNVTFMERVTFADKDAAGFARVAAGETEVEITFEKSYTFTPVVTATAQDTFVDHVITDLSTDGFTIVIDESVEEDMLFSWIALAVVLGF